MRLPDPLRYHKRVRTRHVMGDSFMERLSEKVASGMGTVRFLVGSSLIILAWITSNHVVQFLVNSEKGLLNGKGFDPAPFILLNLVFSAVAFYTGALVIISQKAQAKRERAEQDASALHSTELAAREVAHREEIAKEHSGMLKSLIDAMNVETEGGVQAVVKILTERLAQVEGAVLSPRGQAEPEVEPPHSG